MSQDEDKFREYMTTRKRRVTPECEAVLNEALSATGQFNTLQIFDRISKKCCITRATTYRALDDIVCAGILRKVESTADIFERTGPV